MTFKVVGSIDGIETIATGRGIKELRRLRKEYGGTRWRKQKGFARIQLSSGALCHAELHWYEAHGVGRREIKIKRLL
jgi:hypothetical protein